MREPFHEVTLAGYGPPAPPKGNGVLRNRLRELPVKTGSDDPGGAGARAGAMMSRGGESRRS